MQAHTLNRGMAIDVSVGDSVAIHPSVDVRTIVLTVEAKSGQRSRIRIQSDAKAKIEPQKKADIG